MIRGRTANGWLQIEDTNVTGYRVQPGFSGGAVWDEQLDGVVGMVTVADRQPEVRAAFIIPTDRLVATWHLLKMTTWKILIAHAKGEEHFAEQLAVPLREAGYKVAHQGTVLVGESVVEEASKVLNLGGPVVLCGTVRAVGTPLARRLVRATQHYPGVRVFAVQMEEDADIKAVTFGETIAHYWQDPAKAIDDLLAALHRHYPLPERPQTAVRDNADLLHPYLQWLVRQHSTLELRGIRQAGRSPTVELNRVFIALRGGPNNPEERIQSQSLLELEAREMHPDLNWERMGDGERRMWRWRRLAFSPLMPSLVERDRPSLFTDRKVETLSLGECFCRYRWLVILGDPGSGKTTLSRWLVLNLARSLANRQARVHVPAHQVNPRASDGDTQVDLGPIRLPVLLRVSEFAQARQEQPDLLLADFLGHHTWLSEVPTHGTDHARQGERLDPDGLNALIKEYLRQEQAIIILDGLDEITTGIRRDQVVRAVETFIRDWIRTPDGQNPFDDPNRPWRWTRGLQSPREAGGNQLIVTSRIAGYHDSPLSGYLTHFTIEPMPSVAIDRFCESWTAAVHRLLADPGESQAEIDVRARREANSLKAAIHDPHRPGIAEMASNPLLLTILSLVHHNSRARLPEQRVRLYQIAVENLVEVWRETGLREDEVVNVLGPLAAHIHAHYATGLIPEPELGDIISEHLAAYRGVDPQDPPPAFCETVDQFLRVIRQQVGLLAARGQYLYGFLGLDQADGRGFGGRTVCQFQARDVAAAAVWADAVGLGGLPAYDPRGQLLVWGNEGEIEVDVGLGYFGGVARSSQGVVNHVGAGEHLSLAHQESRADDVAIGCADADYGWVKRCGHCWNCLLPDAESASVLTSRPRRWYRPARWRKQ